MIVAVAANFLDAHEEIANRFTARTGIEVLTSPGSTGQLSAQIRNGAPYEVFLAADTVRPGRLEAAGLVVPGSRFAYAYGRLVLYGPGLDSVRDGGSDLASEAARRVAIANPRTAPYGTAAMEVLEALGIEGLGERLVRGESVGQAYQFVDSGAAELGFVALSQVVRQPSESFWLVPDGLHSPIVQEAVALVGPGANPAARAYLEFLAGEEARTLIESFGYGVDRSEEPFAEAAAIRDGGPSGPEGR